MDPDLGKARNHNQVMTWDRAAPSTIRITLHASWQAILEPAVGADGFVLDNVLSEEIVVAEPLADLGLLLVPQAEHNVLTPDGQDML